MLVDSRDLENGALIEGEICIVGAGAAGISIALDWLDTHHRVILLESGGMSYDDRVQELEAGHTSGQKYFPLKSARLRYFGGTMDIWAGYCTPLDEIDFEKRSWVAESGWPIAKRDLDPDYEKAQQVLKIGPCHYDLEYWQSQYSNLAPLPFDRSVLWNKMWQFSSARFNQLYRDSIIKSRNVALYTYANAVEILTTHDRASVHEIVIKNYAGKTHRVRAKRFVLACGAIQNARLLLASNAQIPQGLGNENDLVGRYFMEHVELASGELWLFEPLKSVLYSLPDDWIRPRAELAVTEGKQRELRLLNGTVSLSPLSFARHVRPRIQSWQDDDPRKSVDLAVKDLQQAAAAAKSEEGRETLAYQLEVRMEQAPNRDSRITIGPDKDEFGVPRSNLHWVLTMQEKLSIRKILWLIGEQAGIAGIGRVRLREFLHDKSDSTWPVQTGAGWHHMGTTKMGADPKSSVVDSNCKIHSLSNLYVAGSGCFPTAGAANPTLTLIALALRLSNHLKKML